MLYVLVLSSAGLDVPPYAMGFTRDADTEAVDTAIRRLRLHRNTAHPNATRYDRWEVHVWVNGRGLRQIASGASD